MNPVYWISDCATTPLASSSEENYALVKQGKSSVAVCPSLATSDKPFYASLFSGNSFSSGNDLTSFESLCLHSLKQAIAKSEIDFSSAKTIFILSTTKGNIELINAPDERLNLHAAANRILAKQKLRQIYWSFQMPVFRVFRHSLLRNACWQTGIMIRPLFAEQTELLRLWQVAFNRSTQQQTVFASRMMPRAMESI